MSVQKTFEFFCVCQELPLVVDLFGSWDDWKNPVPCERACGGDFASRFGWKTKLNLKPGVYEYKFRVIYSEGGIRWVVNRFGEVINEYKWNENNVIRVTGNYWTKTYIPPVFYTFANIVNILKNENVVHFIGDESGLEILLRQEFNSGNWETIRNEKIEIENLFYKDHPNYTRDPKNQRTFNCNQIEMINKKLPLNVIYNNSTGPYCDVYFRKIEN